MARFQFLVEDNLGSFFLLRDSLNWLPKLFLHFRHDHCQWFIGILSGYNSIVPSSSFLVPGHLWSICYLLYHFFVLPIHTALVRRSRIKSHAVRDYVFIKMTSRSFHCGEMKLGILATWPLSNYPQLSRRNMRNKLTFTLICFSLFVALCISL